MKLIIGYSNRHTSLSLFDLKIVIDNISFIGLILCSYLIEKVLYKSYHYDNIFAIFIYGGLGLLWFFCFYKIFKKEQNSFLIKSRLTKYWKSIVSIFSLI